MLRGESFDVTGKEEVVKRMKRYVFGATTWLGFLVVAMAGVLSFCSSSSGPLKVGVLLPLTGSSARYGQSVRRGLDYALDRHFEKDAKRDVLLLYRDSQALPEKGLQLMKELIDKEGVPVVLVVSSGEMLACGPLANETKTLLLSPTASAPEIAQLGEWVFRTTSSDELEGITMANYCIRQKYERVAVAYIDNAYGRGLMRVFRDDFQRKGGIIPFNESFAQGQTDFVDLVEKLRKSKPDAVYMPGYVGEMMAILQRAHDIGWKPQWLASASLYVNEVARIKDAAEGVVLTLPSYDPKDTDKLVASFVQGFQKEYGEVPDIFSASAFDAMNILLHAAEIGGHSAEDLRGALKVMQNVPGVTGRTTFDENGEVTRIPRIAQFRDGDFRSLQ